jgi:type I restriction enzyme S subunit
MHRLLTKGIGHKEFKTVKIGIREYRIPASWNVNNLESTSTVKGRIGWQGLTTKEYLDKGNYFLVTGTDFERGRILWEKCVYVEEERYSQDPNIQLNTGDILITKDGSIGKIAYVDYLPKKATLNSGIFVVRPKNNGYDTRYMYWVMNSHYFNSFMNVLKAGSTISHLYQRDFIRFEFPLPLIKEQQKIASILSTIDQKLELERNRKAKLESIKKGLMNDLLTGRKRVKV